MYKLCAICAFLSLTIGSLWAQCTSDALGTINGNQVNAKVYNGGDMFWNLVNQAAYEVPKGSGLNALFSSSVWVGGLDGQGSLHMSAGTYRQSGVDFYPGPYRNQFAYNCGKEYDTPSACSFDGALWLASGKVLNLYNGGFQVYDEQTQTAINRVLPTTYQNLRAVELPNGDVMLMSWRSSAASPSEVMVIDTATFNLPTPDTLAFFQQEGAMIVMPTGKVLIIGPLGVEEYDPLSHTTTVKAPTNSMHQHASAIYLSNGKVLLAGGTTSTVEIYDPSLNTWQNGPVMSISRPTNPTLTALPSGEIFIAGGSSVAANTDVYDPVTNTIVAGPAAPEAIRMHQAFLIAPDEILFVYGPRGNQLDGNFILNRNNGSYRVLPFVGLDMPAAYRQGTLIAGTQSHDHFSFIDVAAGRRIDARWQHVWKVNRAEVLQFQTDFGNNAVNFQNYPEIETWPGNGNVWAGEDAQLAPYVDVDNDGVYDPLHDGDYPCFPGDQALWWVFNDDGAHGETQSSPFPLQIEVLAYVFDCSSSICPDTALDYTTFYHYEITNKSSQAYHEVYMGMWRDVDLGNYGDDYVACDTNLSLGIGFNGDANDETSAGYGLNPPAIGSLLLPNGQVDKMSGFMYYANDFTAYGNPEQASHYYGYLQNTWKNGAHLQLPGTTQDINYAYPGDAGWCGGPGNGGWTESSSGNQPFDRRFVQSFGLSALAANQSIDLDLAIVYARGYYNDNLGSVCELITHSSAIQNWWMNTLDRSCFSLVLDAPEAAAVAATQLQVYPNPTAGKFTVVLPKAERTATAVKLINLQGQLAWQGTVPAGLVTFQIDPDGLPNGLYFLQVCGRQDLGIHKIVLER